MQPSNRCWTLALTSAALFMVALDSLVVTTTLPAIRIDLGASLAELEWTVNAYNLTLAVFLLLGAALGERFGRRRSFVAGLALFTAASAAAAIASTPGALVAARAAQGLGAAVAMPLTLTLLSEAFPPGGRGAVLGIWGGVAGAAVGSGPLIGGALVEAVSWPWVFWINVPIGATVAALAARRLVESFGRSRNFDLPGVALASAGLLAILWAVQQGEQAGWASREIVAALTVGTGLVVAFLVWEARAPMPLVPLRLFRNTTLTTAIGAGFLMAAALFGAAFMVAQYLQFARGYSPLVAGAAMLPWTATPIVVSPLAGRLADRFGDRPFIAGGLVLQALGFAWLALAADAAADYPKLVGPLLVAGVGISLVFPTVAKAVVDAVAPDEVGIAAGANSALRQLGAALGVAIVGVVFAHSGAFASPREFTHGLAPALAFAAGLSAAGAIAALAVRTRYGAPAGMRGEHTRRDCVTR
ncbi:MAG: MFS transporter [Actinomycetota bacterium]|nr:MFS transporter [Actinomycetota bacterium]